MESQYYLSNCLTEQVVNRRNLQLFNVGCGNSFQIRDSNNITVYHSGCCATITAVNSSVNVGQPLGGTMCGLKLFVSGGNVNVQEKSCCFKRVELPPPPMRIPNPLNMSEVNLQDMRNQYPPAPPIPIILPHQPPLSTDASVKARILKRLPEIPHEGVNTQCIICTEPILLGQPEMFLVCFHSFHSKCIKQWFEKNLTCPSCNLEIGKHV